MKANISRRSLLAGAGCAAAGSVLGQLLSTARAGEAAPAPPAQAGGICFSMIFEDGSKTKFDSGKYVKTYLPLLREVYGDSVERIELLTVAGSDAAIRSAPAYSGMSAVRASTTFWIKDVPAFGQKLGANAPRINKELDAIAKGNRLAQLDRIVLALGDARNEVLVDSQVFSLYFRPLTAVAGLKGGAVTSEPTFDQQMFTEAYLPKLYSLLGPAAVHRLEASVGVEQNGKKPAQIAAYHIYIRDRAAFDQQSKSAFAELKDDAAKLTQNTVSIINDMRVTGIA